MKPQELIEKEHKRNPVAVIALFPVLALILLVWTFMYSISELGAARRTKKSKSETTEEDGLTFLPPVQEDELIH